MLGTSPFSSWNLVPHHGPFSHKNYICHNPQIPLLNQDIPLSLPVTPHIIQDSLSIVQVQSSLTHLCPEPAISVLEYSLVDLSHHN